MNTPAVRNNSENIPSFVDTTLMIASRFFGLPSRLVARVRRLDDVLNAADAGAAAAQSRAYENGGTPPNTRNDDARVGFGIEPLPGPLGFVTSGYFFGLFVMALILNRIQNIVVPPRNLVARRVHAGRNSGGRLQFLRVLLDLFFPVDLSSTFSRCIFRIPSIYLLSKALLLWMVLLLQAARLWPSWQWDWLQSVGQWAARKDMEDICWFTFTATCLALAIGALTSGLEGLQLNHNAPFNLFSFAFQLHIYSSPSTHEDRIHGLPSRPSKHVMLTLMMPLLQLTILHCLEVKKRWARFRLIPTSICSSLSLLHFHSVIWSSPSAYPLTNFFPCVVESMLITLITFSASLNVVTQLLLEGAVTRPLFGHVETLMPKMDEDFGVALVRLGTASLEATSAAGMGNEVGGVTSAGATVLVSQVLFEEDHGVVEIDRSGVISITPSFDRKGYSRVRRRGFRNELTNVKAQALRSDLWTDSMVNAGWHKAVLTFCFSAVRALRRLLVNLWRGVRGRTRGGHSSRREPYVQSAPMPRPDDYVEDEEDVDDADVYRRFLRGESVSDDEDEFVPAEDVPRDHAMAFQAEGAGGGVDSDDEGTADGSETAGLLADLSRDTPSSSTPVLLAHMASTSGSPLTRRRYRSLVSEQQDNANDWNQYARERREVKVPVRHVEDDSSDSRRNCVICTVEPRDIICWPCRCLALCNDCRENLSSRSSASKHTCPCCRRSVEGYSRIYIP